MSKYIDAEAFSQLINRTLLYEELDYPDKVIYNAAISDMLGMLKHFPEKRGHWIVDRKFGNDVMSDEQMVICSECGKGIFWGKQNYCPNCGSRMVGEDE